MIDCRDGNIGVFGLEHDWGPDLQDIGKQALAADQHALVADKADHLFCFPGRWFAGFAVEHEFNSKSQPGSAHVANNLVLVHELLEALLEISASGSGICHKALITDHVKHGDACRAGHIVAAEG